MKRLLVANRGEIAVRIIRAARELEIETVAIYSDADQGSLHTRLADYRIALNGRSATETYLNIDKVITAAIQSGADSIHPGYGFLSENPYFAEAAKKNGLIFVGPRPETISLMGAKDQARKTASLANVPVLPGTEVHSCQKATQAAINEFGYPVMLKAIYGGSGRGMRIATDPSQLKEKFEEASREALAAFGNGGIFVEKYLPNPRHIEVQIFGDAYGNVVHLFERDCSLQRRHQKLVEESPAPNLPANLRDRICKAAVELGRHVNYIGAGTVEFLVETDEENSARGNFYFLEMNTRIQVEHAVTEQTTSIDLVKLQLLIADGKKLPYSQQEISNRGHAIEFRVYAENPSKNFSPTTGQISYISRPFGIGVREDSWIEAGTAITPYYDSLLSKLTIYGNTRSEALARAGSLLSEYRIEGVNTTLEFHRWLLKQTEFIQGQVHTNWTEKNYNNQTVYPDMVGPLNA